MKIPSNINISNWQRRERNITIAYNFILTIMMMWLGWIFLCSLQFLGCCNVTIKVETANQNKRQENEKKLWAIRPTEQWATLIFDSSHIYIHGAFILTNYFSLSFLLFFNLFWDVSFIVTAHFKMMRIVKPDFMSCSVLFFFVFIVLWFAKWIMHTVQNVWAHTYFSSI